MIIITDARFYSASILHRRPYIVLYYLYMCEIDKNLQDGIRPIEQSLTTKDCWYSLGDRIQHAVLNGSLTYQILNSLCEITFKPPVA